MKKTGQRKNHTRRRKKLKNITKLRCTAFVFGPNFTVGIFESSSLLMYSLVLSRCAEMPTQFAALSQRLQLRVVFKTGMKALGLPESVNDLHFLLFVRKKSLRFAAITLWGTVN